MNLRILSWNVHTPPLSPNPEIRLARVAHKIKSLAPDLVLLQEVWFDSGAELLERELRDGYEMIPATEGGSWLTRPSGLLAFLAKGKRRRFVVSETSFVPFGAFAPRWRLWEGDGLGVKGVQRIALEHAGQSIEILNTHLQAQYGATTYDAIREQQRATLVRLAREIPGDRPVIACGDLNSAPGELDLAFWQDHTDRLRAACGCGTSLSEPGNWIDFVLSRRSPGWTLRSQVELVANRIADDPYSDHEGLLADFVISPSQDSPRLSWMAAVVGYFSLCARSPSATRREILARSVAGALLLATSGLASEEAEEAEPARSPKLA